MTSTGRTALPGWYRDPWQPAALRWWTGRDWSGYVRQSDEPLTATELAHLHYLEEFLDSARAEHAISTDTYRALLARAAARQEALARPAQASPAAVPPRSAEAGRTPAATAAAPSQAPWRPPAVAPRVPPSRPSERHAGAVRPATPPGAVSRAVRRMRTAVQADLAIHGLAYLGVLLMFAGLFGFVVFSFSSVRVGFRPVAEVMVPAVVLGSAWLLDRRKLAVPARALIFLAGLLLLVVTLAAFVDGAPVPPDPSGIPLVITLAAVPAALAAGYGWLASRRRASPLRHLVAPALWLAVAMAALGWRSPVPGGRDIATPGPGQLAAVLVAIALTVAVARTRPGARLPAKLYPAGLIGLGVAAVLEGLAAGVAGWPAVPVAVSGAAVVVALELSGQIPGAARTVLQAVVVALTGLSLVPALGVGWAGAAAAVAALAVTELGMRRAVPAPSLLAPVVLIVAGLAAAGWAPLALVGACAAVSVWAHLRRLWPDGWPYPALALTVTAAVAPAGVLAGLAGLLPAGLATAVTALIVLPAGVGARILARPADRFWSWWLPAAAVVLLAVTAGQDATAWTVTAAAAASATIVASPLPAVPRIWLAAPAVAWSAWLCFEVTGLAMPGRMLVLAGAGVVTVAIAAVWRSAAAGHAGVIGHIAGLTCWPLAIAWAGTANAATPERTLGLAVAGLAVTAAAQEAGHGAVPDLLVRCGTRLAGSLGTRAAGLAGPALRMAPPAVAAALLIPFVAWLRALLGVSVPADWWPLAISALGLAYVLAAWPLRRWHRVARVLADAGLPAAVVAAAACRSLVPALAALAVVMLLPALAAPALRRRTSVWISWAATVPFAVVAARLGGVPGSYWYATSLGWGAVLLTGGLGADNIVAGRREAGSGIRAWWLLPPVAVGAAASLAGLIGSAGGTPAGRGWALIAAAAVTAAAGVLLRAGVLGGVAAAMAVGGLESAGSWAVPARLWLLLGAAATVLIAADIARVRMPQTRPPWQRWDLSLFVAAHVFAAAAAVLSLVSVTSVAPVLADCGGLALGISARLRRWPWAAGGSVLVLSGASAAGAGWAALAFAGAAVLATALAVGRRGWRRTTLQVAGAAAAAGAWAAALVWLEAGAAGAVEATSVAAGLVVLIAASASRIAAAAAEWARVWGGLAIALTTACAAALALPAVTSSARLYVAAALAATAAGCALAASPLRLGWLREASAVAAMASALAAAMGTSADLHDLTWGATAAALMASGAVLAPWTRRVAAAWVRPALLVAVTATVAALACGGLSLPDRALLVPACLAAAVLVAALAVVLQRPALAAVTPVPLYAAWIAYASEALTGQPQWYTVPAGAAVLAATGVLRSARRAGGQPVATPDVVVLEITGMAMIVAASLVQGFTRGPGYDLIGAVLALALVAWGVLTRVRRRLIGGAAAFGLCLLLLIAIPLAGAVPHWSGLVGWLALAVVGLAAMAAAAVLDVTRKAVKRGVARLSELTMNWE